MEDITLASEWKRLRLRLHLSQTEIANRCDVSRAVLCKVENGRLCRWESMHLFMAVGMKIRPGTPDYELIQRLWIEERQKHAKSLPEDHGAKKAPEHVVSAMRAFRKIIKKMKKQDVQALLHKIEGWVA